MRAWIAAEPVVGVWAGWLFLQSLGTQQDFSIQG